MKLKEFFSFKRTFWMVFSLFIIDNITTYFYFSQKPELIKIEINPLVKLVYPNVFLIFLMSVFLVMIILLIVKYWVKNKSLARVFLPLVQVSVIISNFFIFKSLINISNLFFGMGIGFYLAILFFTFFPRIKIKGREISL
jgi:hypothetical protein